jgi:hypothetical protein
MPGSCWECTRGGGREMLLPTGLLEKIKPAQPMTLLAAPRARGGQQRGMAASHDGREWDGRAGWCPPNTLQYSSMDAHSFVDNPFAISPTVSLHSDCVSRARG